MWFKLNTNKQIVIKSSTVVTLPNVDTLIVLSLLRTNREPKITKRSLMLAILRTLKKELNYIIQAKEQSLQGEKNGS